MTSWWWTWRPIYCYIGVILPVSTVCRSGGKHLDVGFHFLKHLETGIQMFSKSAGTPYSGDRRPKHPLTLSVICVAEWHVTSVFEAYVFRF